MYLGAYRSLIKSPSAGGVVTLTALTSASDGTDKSAGNDSWTFAGVTLSAGKKIVIATGMSFDNTVGVTLSCTVDGQTTTLLKSQTSAGAFTAVFETDSTVAAASGDVVISYASATRTGLRCTMFPFHISGHGAASDVESGTASTSSVSTSSTVTIPANGAALAVAQSHASAIDFTFTWTGHAESQNQGPDTSRTETALNTTAGTETVSADNTSATQKNIVVVAWPAA